MQEERFRISGRSYDSEHRPIGEISGNFWLADIEFWVTEMLRYGRDFDVTSEDGRQEVVDLIVEDAEVAFAWEVSSHGPTIPWETVKKELNL